MTVFTQIKSKSSERKENEDEEKKTPDLFLLRFPQLVILEVIALMNTTEQINLASISKRMKAWVKILKIRHEVIDIHFKEVAPYIRLPSCTVFCTRSEFGATSKVSAFDRIAEIEKNLTSIYLYGQIRLYLYWPYILRIDTTKQSPLYRILQKCTSLVICKEDGHEHYKRPEIDRCILENVLNATKSRILEIRNLNIPSDFRINYPLRFQRIHYDDARWLRVDDLSCLRNFAVVKLEQTNFNEKDIHNFIAYWTFYSSDMFDLLTLKTSSRMDPSKIFKGLTILKSTRLGQPLYYITPSYSSKKKPFMCIYFSIEDNLIQMSAWPKGRREIVNNRIIVEKEGDILELLVQKGKIDLKFSNRNREELQKEIKRIDNELEKYQVTFNKSENVYVFDNVV